MRDIVAVFTKLGFLGFGGPTATIAMMEEETVRRRGWLSPERFSEIYAVCKLLPGPVATQVAIYVSLTRGGRWGGAIGGALFVLPAFLIVLALSYLYVSTGAATRLEGPFAAMQAAALGIIFLSTLQLARPYRSRFGAWALAGAATVCVFLAPRLEPIVILFCGMVGAFTARQGARHESSTRAYSPAWPLLAALFWVCFKSGAFVFGTGLAVVPVLEADVVGLHHWLTRPEFMDGLALGQITPGPVVITATFIGYKTAGILGALVATAGIFLPAFANILFVVPRIWDRISGTPASRGFSDWAVPAVVGGILGTTARLSVTALAAPSNAIIAAITFAAGAFWRVPAWILIPAAGVVGWVLRLG